MLPSYGAQVKIKVSASFKTLPSLRFAATPTARLTIAPALTVRHHAGLRQAQMVCVEISVHDLELMQGFLHASYITAYPLVYLGYDLKSRGVLSSVPTAFSRMLQKLCNLVHSMDTRFRIDSPRCYLLHVYYALRMMMNADCHWMCHRASKEVLG